MCCLAKLVLDRKFMNIFLGLVLVFLHGIVTSHADAERPTKTRPPASPFEIELESHKFTPTAGIPSDLVARIKKVIDQAASDNPRAHILLQLQAPPDPSGRTHLADRGITLLMPVNKLSWHASVTTHGAEELPRAKEIRWADLMQARDKLAKVVQKGELFPYNLRPDNRVAYSVLFHKDVTADEVLALAKRLNARLEGFDPKAFPVVRTVTFDVPRGVLEELAEADIVAWIEPSEPPFEKHNLLNAQPLSRVNLVQAAPFNLSGTGVTVGVWEVDATVDGAHLDLTPRVVIETGQTNTLSDHAAHVAGTIAGSGANVANAEGMAPAVGLTSWDATNDAVEMTNAATSSGGSGQPTAIQISNHSYGLIIGWNNAGTNFTNNQGLFGQYTNLSQAVDNVVFQTGLMVFKSAGNDRDDVPATPVTGQPGDCLQGGLGVAADCIESRGVAKNVFTIGAMNGMGAIAAFSSFGPTDDGRIKPDLMAQGVGMLSLACTTCFTDGNGDGIDDVPNSNIASTTMGGTSMATPVVAGVAALILQDARNRRTAMNPAAMKALLIQTARDVQGIGQANVGPDYATGWGIVDAEAAIKLLRQGGLIHGTLSATGNANTWTRTFYVPSNQAELHLTLAWDDPPGNPTTPQNQPKLVNDLDLRLIAPDGTQFTPWTLDPANPAQAAVRNGGNDAVNNVEQVSVVNPMAGVWTAEVSANANNLLQPPQAFAVAGPFRLFPYEYPVRLACGTQSVTKPFGRYDTSINVHNPLNKEIRFNKKLALAYSTGRSGPRIPRQAPGPIFPIAEDVLGWDQALATNCDIIGKELANVFPSSTQLQSSYYEGFLVIQSEDQLDVTAMYSSEPLEQKNLSVDVEHVAPACPIRTETVPGRTFFFVPPHVRGDREYDGHGPCVVFDLVVEIGEDGKSLIVKYRMHAYECSNNFDQPRSDYTAALGVEEIVLTTANRELIVGHNSETHMTFRYIDTNHAEDIFSFPAPNPVQQLRFVGDTGGDEAGTKTSAFITLREMNVDLAMCKPGHK
jgi:subtilisin family serine protease